MKILRFIACAILTFICFTYTTVVISVNSIEAKVRQPLKVKKTITTYVVTTNGNVPLKDFKDTERKAKQVKIPPSFSKDQQQQVVKVSQLLLTPYGKEVFRHADKVGRKYQVEPNLILAIILTESGFDQYAKNGNSYGLMQLSDNTTASRMCQNMYDVGCNIDASTKHLAGLQAKYDNDTRLALAAYNAGGGMVDKSLRVEGDIPVATRDYVHKVKKYRQVINVVIKYMV